jgi:hypothetical protein
MAKSVDEQKYFLRVINTDRLVIYPESFPRLIAGEMDLEDYRNTNWFDKGQVFEVKDKSAQLELLGKVLNSNGLPIVEIAE